MSIVFQKNYKKLRKIIGVKPISVNCFMWIKLLIKNFFSIISMCYNSRFLFFNITVHNKCYSGHLFKQIGTRNNVRILNHFQDY